MTARLTGIDIISGHGSSSSLLSIVGSVNAAGRESDVSDESSRKEEEERRRSSSSSSSSIMVEGK